MVQGSKGPNPDRDRSRITVPIVVGVTLGLVLLSLAFLSGHLGSTGPSTSGCSSPDAQVSDPTAPHGMFVLSPPVNAKQAYYADSNQFLVNNSVTCGADFWVHWNQIDSGPNASVRYNWSSVAQEISPWQEAGKKVNLIFQTVGYGPNQSWIPSYVLPQIQTIQCGQSPLTPLFWKPSYVALYDAYMRAVVAHFQGDPAIGYIRFGLGTGGEAFPLYGLQYNSSCDRALNATGFTVTNWTSYLVSMLEFEHSLGSSVQLMVALNSVFPGIRDNVSSTVAATAASLGIGFGSEGLALSDVHYNTSGEPACAGGSCRLFEEYAGQVPLEYQTLTASQPNGTGPTGSLTTLLPWAVAMHTQIFELYFVDWLTAFDPNYPAYGSYHTAYSTTFQGAAAVVDG